MEMEVAAVSEEKKLKIAANADANMLTLNLDSLVPHHSLTEGHKNFRYLKTSTAGRLKSVPNV